MSYQLLPDQSLSPNESITSKNGRFVLIFQSDGNLVLYKKYTDGNSKSLWASGTDRRPAQVCIMQNDGNLVIYDGQQNPLWSTETWGESISRLVVQDDGNLVIYRTDNTSVWNSDTEQRNPLDPPDGPRATGYRIQPGETLYPGDSIMSQDGHYIFTYQLDGNLVLYRKLTNRSLKPLWASNTFDQPGQVCIMQNDGNLVIYDRDTKPLWSSDTWGNHNSCIMIQNDGNAVIYKSDNTPVWSTGTYSKSLNILFKIIEPNEYKKEDILKATKDLYGDIGIAVNLIDIETLDRSIPEIAALKDLHVGNWSKTNPSDEQIMLSNLRNNAGDIDIVAYFVRIIYNNDIKKHGVTISLPVKPMVVIATYADLYTLAHEVGHVLGLKHVDDNKRLMFPGETGPIVKVPPDIIQQEIDTMLQSPFVY